MKITSMTKIIDEVLATELEEKGFKKNYFKAEDGRHEWHFQKKYKDIRLMECLKQYISVTFSLFHTVVLLDKELYEFVPEKSLKDMAFGFEFSDEQTFRDLLLRFKPIILEQGIPWLDENYEKYKRVD